MLFAHLGLTLALLTGFAGPPPPDRLLSVFAGPPPPDRLLSVFAGPPPDRLLSARDLPAGYKVAENNQFGSVIDNLFDRAGTAGDRCRLPVEVPMPGTTPRHSVSAVFQNDARHSLDLETVTEILTAPGAKDARALAEAAIALPGRCPAFETPRFSIHLKPLPMPRAGDVSAAFPARFDMKAIGSDNTYVDVMFAEVAVAAKGDVSVTTILFGYSEKHDASLAEVTRRAVQLLG
ncbi:hypothetical protein AB0G04_05330 [Actinoplanes sp. NPDC023801]|uniref:hypothetical protein n=1 Tax=Actinoplanes sp. NPDC023801 TaxID=3154595 RepID=UPI003410AC42